MSVARVLRWPFVLAWAATLVVWFLSLPFNTTITPWGHTLNLCNGGLDVVVNSAAPSNDWSVEGNSPREPMRWWFRCRVYRWSPPHIRGRVPLWSVMLVCAGGTAWGWRAQRRHVKAAQAGRCEKCGYDLRGSAGGRCPECGHAVRDARA